MTTIDFYILPEQGGTTALSTAVKLCDKAAGSGRHLYVTSADNAQLDALGDLLWTQRQGSFLSHERYQGNAPVAPMPQVLLGDCEPPEGWQDILINLAPEVPPFFSRFERVLEIVPGDAANRAKCRERFKFYRDRGYELKMFEQTADGGWLAKV